MGDRLTGRTAIAIGTGRGMALALAKDGSRVVLVGRTAATLEAVRGEIAGVDGAAECLPCEVGDREAVKTMVDAATSVSGGAAILIHNAQDSVQGLLEETTDDDVMRAYQSGPLTGERYRLSRPLTLRLGR